LGSNWDLSTFEMDRTVNCGRLVTADDDDDDDDDDNDDDDDDDDDRPEAN